MSSVRLLLLGAAAALLTGAAQAPIPPKLLPPAEAAKQGRALVADLLAQKPAQNVTNTGVMKIRNAQGRQREIPIKFEVTATPTNWSSRYIAYPVTNSTGTAFPGMTLRVVHSGSQPSRYSLVSGRGSSAVTRSLHGDATMIPFAGSDFWVADLGLEFLHWPQQHLVKRQMRRGQSCDVLESINPHPAPGAYSRVVSWIDIDTGGIIYAEAYGAHGRVLKEFIPKKIKKVRGQWELEEMEMENRQTDSRTWIEFNLNR